MTRLEQLLSTQNQTEFPEDVDQLKREIPGLADVPPGIVAALYTQWCEDFSCAGWLGLNKDTVQSFRDYLEHEIDSE